MLVSLGVKGFFPDVKLSAKLYDPIILAYFGLSIVNVAVFFALIIYAIIKKRALPMMTFMLFLLAVILWVPSSFLILHFSF